MLSLCLINDLVFLLSKSSRLSDSIADFEAALSVKFTTSKVQEVVTALETTLQASVKVDTVGQYKSVAVYSQQTTISCSFVLHSWCMMLIIRTQIQESICASFQYYKYQIFV